MRFVTEFLLRAVIAYAATYVLWIPFRPAFTWLVAVFAEGILRVVGDPPLVTRLVAGDGGIAFYGPLTGTETAMASWSAEDLTVLLVAPLALGLAAARDWSTRWRAAPLLLLLLFLFCACLAAVQIELTADFHASSTFGVALHTPQEKALLERINGGLYAVGMLALPAFVFLATYVWGMGARTAGGGRRGSQRRARLATALAFAGVGIVGLFLSARPQKQEDDPSRLLRSWEKITRINPHSAPAKVNYGFFVEESGELDRAIGLYRGALEIDPDLVEARYNLANALRKQGHLDEAAARYAEVVDRAPRHAFAHRNLALTLEGLGRPCEALTHLRESAVLDPHFMTDTNLRSWLERLSAACPADRGVSHVSG